MNEIRFNGFFLPVNFSCYKISGDDATSFLNGQTTNNVKNLTNNTSHLNTLLNIQGKIEGVFNLYKHSTDSYLLFCESEQQDKLLERLEKYLIIEDVNIELLDIPIVVAIGEELIYQAQELNEDSCLIGSYFGDRVLYILDPEIQQKLDFEVLGIDELKSYKVCNGFIDTAKELDTYFLPETTLSESSLDLAKGCFLGQEVVAKVINNRGAAKYPVYCLTKKKQPSEKVLESIKVDGLYLNWLNVKRENRVVGKEIELNEMTTVCYFPYFKNDSTSKSTELFDMAIIEHNQDNLQTAIRYLELSLNLDASNEDAYEILGVLVGRTGEHKKAIKIIQKLAQLNPESIMAHTNLSYFYMQDGQIEKAEEEKSISIGLQMNLDDPVGDDAIEFAELDRREEMFKQVLEIDAQDVMALNGMGEICLKRKNYQTGIDFFKNALIQNKKHSVAYLNLSKTYLALNRTEEAREVLLKGIEVAANNGEMKPANEMQSLLNQIKKT
jgi:folate-binding Fe-S cluster repair protein YgfZ/Flp pilus assembly protein TadD